MKGLTRRQEQRALELVKMEDATDTILNNAIRYVDLLVNGIDVVVSEEEIPSEPAVKVWIACSRYPYQVQQGRTDGEAIHAWQRCVLLQMMFDVSLKDGSAEMEHAAWDEMCSRPSVRMCRVRFSDAGW